jgi:glycosyltransferase involved in cell wall biosynthesis
MSIQNPPGPRLRILQVTAQFPFPARSGFEMRVNQLAHQLARSHEVTLLSYAGPDGRREADVGHDNLSVEVVARGPGSRALKRLAQFLSLASRRPFASRAVYSPELQHALDRLAAAQRFDVVQIESSVLCGLRFPCGSRLILDEHNVEYEVFERMHESERSLPRRSFNRLEHRRFRDFEQRWWRQVDGCAVTSEREERIVRSFAPDTPIAVVPNGVDLEYFSPSDEEPDPNTVLFNGVLDYRPNVDAAHHLVDEIWPLVVERCPDARLTIVGRVEPAEARRLRRPGVEVTGQVPDLRPFLARTAVVAVPIRMGGGTRLKVVEGLSMAKAIVSTSLGCEGVDVRSDEHLLVADAPADFAEAIVRLFGDRSLAKRLGQAGRLRMAQEYSWELAGARLEGLYRRVLSVPAGRPPTART